MAKERFSKVLTSSTMSFTCTRCKLPWACQKMERYLDNWGLGVISVWCGRCVKQEQEPRGGHVRPPVQHQQQRRLQLPVPVLLAVQSTLDENRRKARRAASVPVNAPTSTSAVVVVESPKIVVPDINLVL